jgi:hypothetical protein
VPQDDGAKVGQISERRRKNELLHISSAIMALVSCLRFILPVALTTPPMQVMGRGCGRGSASLAYLALSLGCCGRWGVCSQSMTPVPSSTRSRTNQKMWTGRSRLDVLIYKTFFSNTCIPTTIPQISTLRQGMLPNQ